MTSAYNPAKLIDGIPASQAYMKMYLKYAFGESVQGLPDANPNKTRYAKVTQVAIESIETGVCQIRGGPSESGINYRRIPKADLEELLKLADTPAHVWSKEIVARCKKVTDVWVSYSPCTEWLMVVPDPARAKILNVDWPKQTCVTSKGATIVPILDAFPCTEFGGCLCVISLLSAEETNFFLDKTINAIDSQTKSQGNQSTTTSSSAQETKQEKKDSSSDSKDTKTNTTD